MSGSNRKIQPWYWLATINNTKEKTQSRLTEKKTKHAEEVCRGKIDQVGLQEAPNLQDSIQNHLEYSKC
jgi:hypothetical protein